MSNQRRHFLKKAVSTAALSSFVSAAALAKDDKKPLISNIKSASANDKIRLGLIGCGIIGHFDLNTALKVPGTEIVAVCDLYDARLIRAKEVWGNQIFTTRDYREIVQRKDIDAVLICVPDHWHDRISIEALNAGKHVYCEKPMVHHIEEGAAVIAAHKKSGKVFQVGSQRASASSVLKAREIYESGLIGELTYAEACCDRSDALGAWQYTLPPDLDPKTLDWDKFLGDAPRRPFEANRFFRWRNYKDYGTGVAGDLFVHLITSLHTITSSLGPTQIFSLGDLNFWKDGRDAYDLVTALMNYPKTAQHPSFQFMTRVNLADGSGGSLKTKLIGTEGALEIGWNDLTIYRLKRPSAPMFSRGYDALFTYPKAMQEQFLKQYEEKFPEGKYTRGMKFEPVEAYQAADSYDDRLDHLTTFFNAIRGQGKIIEDAEFGLRAAAPSLACNLSAEKKGIVNWDPVSMKLS
jgi:predicted dehydrogenase